MTYPDRIMIVDDSLEVCNVVRVSLADQGYEITAAHDGMQALEQIRAQPFDVVILDLMLPDLDGIEILQYIREQELDTEIIILTAYASLETAIEALRLGAYDYIIKPFHVNTLQSAVRRAVEKQHLETRLAAIYDLSHEIALSLDVRQVAQSVLEVVERVLGFETGGLGLVDEEQNELYWPAVHGIKQETAPRMSLTDEGGIAVAAVRSGRPLYVPDVREDPRYLAVNATTRSELAVPLKIGGHVIGVLNTESDEVDGFSQSDTRLISTLAAQASVAIENARLHELARQEIAERKQAEEEIRRHRDYYRAVVDGLHDQVIVVDRDCRVTDVNAAFLRQMGHTREEVIGRRCHELIHRQGEIGDDAFHSDPAQQVWETGQPTRFTQASYDRDGDTRWFDVTVSPLYDAEGQVTQVVEAYRDVTTERRLEEKLAGVHSLGQDLVLSRNEKQVAQVTTDSAIFLLQARLCGLWLTDEEKRILIPQAYAGQTESMNLYGRPLDDEEDIIAAVARSGEPIYVPAAQKEPGHIDPATNAGREASSELCVPLKVRDELIGVLYAESAGPDGFDETAIRSLSVLADYSALALQNARLYEAEREQRRLLEESQIQLVQSEKLAATGRLASSLAHEINNPLQAIHNSLQLMLSFPLEPGEQQEYLQIASEEVERLVGLVSRMLSFARRPQREMKPTDLNKVVEKVLALTHKYLQHHRVALWRDLCPDLPAVLGNPDELGQVFMNIVLNGVDAMTEGGTLRVSSRIAADERLAVVISDTGPGIPSNHLDRIFEPFFSTKDDGSGLGLSISHSIVERHGGEITVQSIEGEGTTFTVWLPVMQE